MKSFTSLVLITFLSTATTLTFTQSAKANFVIQNNLPSDQYCGGYLDYRTYYPHHAEYIYQHQGYNYQLYRPSYECWYCFNHHRRGISNHFSVNGINYRIDYGRGYPSYNHIRYRP